MMEYDSLLSVVIDKNEYTYNYRFYAHILQVLLSIKRR